ncbi:response regulator transcription factor [Actinomadura sp. 7K507]|uniref:response regulator n=1 Tax=Actinomadura sp. 7K507 TaxID=2530365 RepID=UPI0010495DCC|nr:response regulator transcription factor [Actinomadura sp. 7K507]TDC73905.1 response regulator transcription factor [Actinomadura sp. 7K507]
MPPGDGINVVIADDERVVRDGLRAILETQDDIAVTGTAGDGDHALRLCRDLRPDVLLLDVRMPGHDGLWTLGRLARDEALGPGGTRALMLTTFDLDEYVDEALTLGASGFLLKSSSYEELLAAVRAAAGGDGALSPSVARRVIDGYAAHRRARRADPADLARLHGLTPRENDVLQLIGDGLSNSEIAARLVVSEHTVKSHVSRILGKLELRSRGQAAALSRRTRP